MVTKTNIHSPNTLSCGCTCGYCYTILGLVVFGGSGSQLSINNRSSRKRFIPSHPELQPECCKCTANPPSTQIFLMKWLVDYSLKLQMTSLYRSHTFHPFMLHIDASKQGLGEVFYQNQGGKMRVIVYGPTRSHQQSRATISTAVNSSFYHWYKQCVTGLGITRFTIPILLLTLIIIPSFM